MRLELIYGVYVCAVVRIAPLFRLQKVMHKSIEYKCLFHLAWRQQQSSARFSYALEATKTYLIRMGPNRNFAANRTNCFIGILEQITPPFQQPNRTHIISCR